MSLFSYVYANKLDFAPLLTSARDSDPLANSEVQREQRCSPRSMYSLTTAVSIFYRSIRFLVLKIKKLGIKTIKEKALKDIRSKLTTVNIAQELFTSFAAR